MSECCGESVKTGSHEGIAAAQGDMLSSTELGAHEQRRYQDAMQEARRKNNAVEQRPGEQTCSRTGFQERIGREGTCVEISWQLRSGNLVLSGMKLCVSRV